MDKDQCLFTTSSDVTLLVLYFQNNLPMFVPSATPQEALAHLFTTAADSDPLNAWNILDDSNTNLSNSQKELLV